MGKNSGYNGYWEPHSSSVEFCEPNYLLTSYIAEPHNTWSSALITLLAIFGFLYGNPTKELRFSVMYLILGAIGIGSVGLHSTLHWLPQSSDEVPMLWHSLSSIYSLLCAHEKIGSNRVKLYGYAFFTLSLLQTIIYYQFQQIYAMFIVSLSVYILIVSVWMYYLAFIDTINCRIRRKLWWFGFTMFVVVGAGLWIIDMNFCNELLPYYSSPYLQGLTLHVLWHLCSGLGAYGAITFMIVVRIQALNQKPHLDWVMGGLIPICSIASTKK